MPVTGYSGLKENPAWEKIKIAGVENASAMFFYNKGSGYDEIIHTFKYKGRSSAAYQLGKWFGQDLKESFLYSDIDLVVPVPLHPLRLISRGYNQSAYISRGIAKILGCRLSTSNLVRVKYNRSQTEYSKKERWVNVEGIFNIINPSIFENKHILLVDDVLTTGATLEECIETIKKKVDNCRISVAVLAVTPHDILGKD